MSDSQVVINPFTGRPVKIGTRAYVNMQKQLQASQHNVSPSSQQPENNFNDVSVAYRTLEKYNQSSKPKEIPTEVKQKVTRKMKKVVDDAAVALSNVAGNQHDLQIIKKHLKEELKKRNNKYINEFMVDSDED